MTDDVDRRFMAGLLTQKQYDGEMKDLARWAEGQYFANKRIGESK